MPAGLVSMARHPARAPQPAEASPTSLCPPRKAGVRPQRPDRRRARPAKARGNQDGLVEQIPLCCVVILSLLLPLHKK